MAKNEAIKPDDKKVVSANETQKIDVKTPDNVVPFNKTAATKESGNPTPKQKREAKPPTGIKETTPEKEQEPEKPPEPKETPRHGEKEEIVYLKLNDLSNFKNHPFGVRDDEEMRSMVESVRDK